MSSADGGALRPSPPMPAAWCRELADVHADRQIIVTILERRDEDRASTENLLGDNRACLCRVVTGFAQFGLSLTG